MALPKRVKLEGGYFKGYQLAVLTASAKYTLHITEGGNTIVNSIQFVAEDSGDADFIEIGVYPDTGASAVIDKSLATTIYSPGPGTPMELAFPTLIHVASAQDLRFIYVNSGSVPMNVNVYVEYVK